MSLNYTFEINKLINWPLINIEIIKVLSGFFFKSSLNLIVYLNLVSQVYKKHVNIFNSDLVNLISSSCQKLYIKFKISKMFLLVSNYVGIPHSISLLEKSLRFLLILMVYLPFNQFGPYNAYKYSVS